jgi:hypothetical protein
MLVVFASDLYPQLLLVRLLFALGAAATYGTAVTTTGVLLIATQNYHGHCNSPISDDCPGIAA